MNVLAVAASPLDTDGSIVVADDDGGQWYNFAIRESLAPGTYLLRVTHCCAGTGEYRLSTTFTPN